MVPSLSRVKHDEGTMLLQMLGTARPMTVSAQRPTSSNTPLWKQYLQLHFCWRISTYIHLSIITYECDMGTWTGLIKWQIGL